MDFSRPGEIEGIGKLDAGFQVENFSRSASLFVARPAESAMLSDIFTGSAFVFLCRLDQSLLARSSCCFCYRNTALSNNITTSIFFEELNLIEL